MGRRTQRIHGRRQRGRSRFLWIPIILVLVGAASGLVFWFASSLDDWKGLALNLATELVGAAVTYILLVLILERTEGVESEKEKLIADMGSSVKDVAVAAAEKLKQRGWLADGSLSGADLSGAGLSEANLSEANLSGADLVGTDLSGADLGNANLHGANLHGANLPRANLRGADLHGSATLRFANLSETDLCAAKLSEADLYQAKLSGAYLRKAKLSGACLRWAKLTGADLQGADLAGADLQESDLTDAKLDANTTRPDGTNWTPDTDLARFTDADHPGFWRSDKPYSPAYRGKGGD